MGHLEALSDGRTLCAVDACYVGAGARGRGLGRHLLDEMVGWARQHGCIGIDGVALPGDRHAKSFFESAGFKARLLTMHRELT